MAAGLWAVAGRRADAAELRAVRKRLAFEPGERLLAVAADPERGYALVASDRALYHRDADGEWPRLGWEQVAAVIWDSDENRLVVVTLSRRRVAVPVLGRGTVPQVAQERITHSRLGSWRVPITGDEQRHVVVEARRKPASGELMWFVAGVSSASGTSGTSGAGHANAADGAGGTGLAAGAGAGSLMAGASELSEQVRADVARAIARLGHDSGIIPAQAGQRPTSITW